MSKHYPGPWEVFTTDEGRVWIQETTTPERIVVADIPGDMETIEGEELANADLIAAAPDLLAACEALTACLVELTEDFEALTPTNRTARAAILAEAQAAIAKARGEAR